MKQHNNIPQLRFPEFDGEWEDLVLSRVFSFFNGYAFKSSDSRKDGCRWVKIADVGINELNPDNSSYLPESYKDKYPKFLLKKGDYVVALTRPILGGKLKIAQINEEYNNSLLNQRVARIDSMQDIAFVYQLLQQRRLISKIENRIAGTDPPNLSQNEINGIKVSIPTLPEQQKIAQFLTAVDKRIQLLTRKKEQLELYKKGAMQKIFNREIRFKDENGKDFPEWKEKKLGEIGSTFNGLTGKTKDDFGFGKSYVQYLQIFKGSSIDKNGFGKVNVKNNENQNQVKYGDVFFTTSSETPNEIGTASVLTEPVNEVYLNSFCFGYRPNSLDEIVPGFARFFFRSESVRKQIIKLAQGSTRFNMSKVELMKLSFTFPFKGEQQKIAQFLTALDKKIEHTNGEIEKMKEWKRGLLQKMFV